MARRAERETDAEGVARYTGAVIALLVVRNVWRNVRRLAAVIGTLVVIFALLLMSNAVLATATEALHAAYARHVAGDLSVGGPGAQSFTLFGSNAVWMSGRLLPPVVPDFDALRARVERLPEVRATSGVVTLPAQIRLGGGTRREVLFGVDFADHLRLFETLELVRGRWPEAGERAVVLHESWGSVTGQAVLIEVLQGSSFALREVPVVGQFRYPISEYHLNRVALIDAWTARSLNGYVFGAQTAVELDADKQGLLDSALDDLFGFGDDGGTADNGSAGILSADGAVDLAQIESLLADAAGSDALTTIDDAWNFLLVGLHRATDAPRVARAVTEFGADLGRTAGGQGTTAGVRTADAHEYVVRDWRATVGTTARIVWFLRAAINAALLAVAVGSVVIVTNTLVITVLDRTREIGTLRALGATKARVAQLILLETLLTVSGGALAGLLVGSVGLQLLNAAGFSIDNVYLNVLFGGKPIRGALSVALVVAHVGAALAVGLLAVVRPLQRALGISPTKAMAA